MTRKLAPLLVIGSMLAMLSSGCIVRTRPHRHHHHHHHAHPRRHDPPPPPRRPPPRRDDRCRWQRC